MPMNCAAEGRPWLRISPATLSLAGDVSCFISSTRWVIHRYWVLRSGDVALHRRGPARAPSSTSLPRFTACLLACMAVGSTAAPKSKHVRGIAAYLGFGFTFVRLSLQPYPCTSVGIQPEVSSRKGVQNGVHAEANLYIHIVRPH